MMTPPSFRCRCLRVRDRLDDVLLERVVAERLGDDDVGARRVLHLGRMAGHQVAVLRAVSLEDLSRDARDLRGLVEIDLARTELGRDAAP